MAEYTIFEMSAIDFNPSRTAEIIQNVKMILFTPAFSCPLFRDFAWTPPLDDPIPIQKAKAGARIISGIKAFEPRATVVQVTFKSDDQNGRLLPIVRIRVEEG